MSWDKTVEFASLKKDALPEKVADYLSLADLKSMEKPTNIKGQVVSEGLRSRPSSDINFDYELVKLQFPPEQTIWGRQIRYSWFLSDNLVAISFWSEDPSGRFLRKEVFDLENIEEAFKFLCGVRYLQVISYGGDECEDAEEFVSTFLPAQVGLYQVGLDTAPLADTHMSYVIFDEELVAVYEDILDRVAVADTMFFYTEIEANSVDKITLNKLSTPWLVFIESSRRKIIIGSKAPVPPEHRYLVGFQVELTELLRGLTPKPKSSFKDPSAFLQKKTDPKANASGAAAPFLHPYNTDEFAAQEVEDTMMESLKVQLTPRMSMQDLDENLQMMWVMAQSEMEQVIHDGLVPGSTVQSGGLDPDSLDHFNRCVTEIQEAVFEQRYDIALSHLRGSAQVFSESKHPFMKAFFDTENEIEVIRTLFLCSLSK